MAVVSTDELERLIRSVSGRAFAERRDLAIIRLFVDTGMRLSELAGLRVEDLDFEADVAGVLGKGRRMRACPFGNKTAMALQRGPARSGGSGDSEAALASRPSAP